MQVMERKVNELLLQQQKGAMLTNESARIAELQQQLQISEEKRREVRFFTHYKRFYKKLSKVQKSIRTR